MFENIRFERIELKAPVTSLHMERGKKALKEIIRNPDDQPDEFFHDQPAVAFVIEGSSEVVCSSVISEFARQHFLYMQVFALLNAKTRYYTKRKEFPYFLLLYTYEGAGVLEYEGKKYELTPGKGCVIDCRKEHIYHTADTLWKHAILHYTGDIASWLYEQHMADGSPLFECDVNSAFQKNLEQLLLTNQEISAYREYDISMGLNQLLMGIIREKNRELLQVPDYIRYLQRYLESNFTQDMKLDDIAAFAGMSKYHLEREFKRYTGYPVTSYLIELRMTNACFLLSNTRMSIAQAAETAGFSNYPNFLKLFKARMGMTPKEYRGRGGA